MNNFLSQKLATVGLNNRQRQQIIALFSLLAAGMLLGITTNLAKLAPGFGVSPLSYLAWSLSGATLLLLVMSTLKQQGPKINRRMIEYFIVAGFLTTAGANLIFFNAVTRLGVSFVAMMIALPPVFTYVGAILLRMEKFNWNRAAGVSIALMGTALLVAEHWAVADADIGWIALTLVAPILLAAGNLYRTHRWPPGANSESLAPGMLVAGTSMLIIYALVSGEVLKVSLGEPRGVLLIALQSVIFAGQFLLMFVLQKSGGPVFLSLMGGVSAVFGVPIAVGILGEPMLPLFVVSAVLVTIGIVSLLVSQQNSAIERPVQATGNLQQ